MERFKNQRAFIDPISIIAVLFLVVTVVVGTAITTNKDFLLNIVEQAAKPKKTGNTAFDKCREESGRERCNERLGINVNWKGEVVNEIDTSKVDKNITKPGDPTCDANGTQYSSGAVVVYGGIDSYATCGADGKWDVGVGTITQIKPENVPVYAQETYKQAVEKKEADEAKAALELAKEVVIPQQEPVQPEVTGQPIINPIQQKEQQPTVTQTQVVGQPCTNCHTTPVLNTPINEKNLSIANVLLRNQINQDNFENYVKEYGVPKQSQESKIKEAVKTLTIVGATALATAPLVIAGTTISAVGLPVAGLMAMNTIAAATPTISALTVGGLSIGAVDCAINGSNSKLCKTAGDIVIIGYTAAPAEFTQMFNQGVRVYTDTASVLSNIRRIPKIPSQVVPELGSGDDVLNMVWDDVTQKFVMEGSTISKAIVQQQSTLTTIENVANKANSTSQMLFAPAFVNPTDEILANLSPAFQAGPAIYDVSKSGLPPATEITIPDAFKNVKTSLTNTFDNVKNLFGEKVAKPVGNLALEQARDRTALRYAKEISGGEDIPLDVAKILYNGEGGKWESLSGPHEGKAEITNISTENIYGIYSDYFPWNGDQGHMSIQEARELYKSGNFDFIKSNKDPITGYQLTNGEIYITSGRHRATAALLEDQTEIPIQLYMLKDQGSIIVAPTIPPPLTPFAKVKDLYTNYIKDENGFFPQLRTPTKPEVVISTPIKLGEVFDPNVEVNNILSVPTVDRPAALANFKTKLNYQQQGMVDIQAQITNTVTQNPDISLAELKSQTEVLSNKYGLADWQKNKLNNVLDTYTKKHEVIKQYFEKYPSESSFFEAMFGNKPIGNIDITQDPLAIIVTINNAEDFNYVWNKVNTGSSLNPKISTDPSNTIAGFFVAKDTQLSNTGGAVIVVNNSNEITGAKMKSVVDHEEQHILDSVLGEDGVFFGSTPDSSETWLNFRTAIRTKDESKIIPALQLYVNDLRSESDLKIAKEITAYLKEELPIKNISSILKYRDEYNFYKPWADYVLNGLSEQGLYSNTTYNLVTNQLGGFALSNSVDNGLNAFDILLTKGYTRDGAIAILEKNSLSGWIRVADRAGQYIPPTSDVRTGIVPAASVSQDEITLFKQRIDNYINEITPDDILTAHNEEAVSNYINNRLFNPAVDVSNEPTVEITKTSSSPKLESVLSGTTDINNLPETILNPGVLGLKLRELQLHSATFDQEASNIIIQQNGILSTLDKYQAYGVYQPLQMGYSTGAELTIPGTKPLTRIHSHPLGTLELARIKLKDGLTLNPKISRHLGNIPSSSDIILLLRKGRVDADFSSQSIIVVGPDISILITRTPQTPPLFEYVPHDYTLEEEFNTLMPQTGNIIDDLSSKTIAIVKKYNLAMYTMTPNENNPFPVWERFYPQPIENISISTQPPPLTGFAKVKDLYVNYIKNEKGFLPSVRRFLNPIPAQKLTANEVTNLINKTNGPIIEVGGPTLSGYKQVYVPELNRNIYVSNIETGTPVFEKGIQIGSTVDGHVDLLTDSTKLPFADNSVGTILGSALNQETIPQTLSEAYRTLKPDGVLVLQYAKSIENEVSIGIVAEAERLGFKPISDTEIYKFPDKSDNVLRDLVFQKTENITQTAAVPATTVKQQSTLNKFQEQVGNFGQKVVDGSVPIGVGLSPLKYVAGGIISAVFLDDYFNWGIEDKIISLFSTPEITTKEQVQLDNQQKDTQDLKTNVNTVVTTTVAVQPQAENNIQLESIKSGLYAQTDPDIASTLIPGGAGKPFKNIGCGQTTVANILCKYGLTCPTPIEVASMIPLNEYVGGGLTSTQSNIKILNENGFITDPYRKSLQYHLTEYMEPNDVLWISANVGGIPHHTYLDGYSIDSNGTPIYNLNDSYFGDGFKCKTTSDSSFGCTNNDGKQINIAAENANIYIIDTN